MNFTRTLVLNDVHGPFNNPQLIDRQAGGLVLDIAEEVQVDRIAIVGDLLDFYAINSHGAKHPDIPYMLEDEMCWGRDFIYALRKRFPDTEIIYIFGNHEHRLERYILEKARAFWNICSIEIMLDLEKNNIITIPYNDEVQLEKTHLYMQHSPPSYGKTGSRTSLMEKLDQSYIFACSHRAQYYCQKGASGRQYEVFFNGWLGDKDLFPANKKMYQWTKGHRYWSECFSLVNVFNETEYYNQQILIKKSGDKYRCVVDGVLYEA